MSENEGIRSRFSVEKPEEIRMTMTITANMRDWGKLRDNLDFVASLGAGDLVYALRRDIDSMYAQARKIYWPDLDPNAPEGSS